jgi:hypothetical protein
MDDLRFDRLAKLIGAQAPRRRVLKLLGGGLFGLAVGIRRAPAVLAGAGQFGDTCTVDDDCDTGALLTCDDDRGTCRGGTGFACFDTGDCSTADGLLCLDDAGAECTGEEAECGTCGVQGECAGDGDACTADDNCCGDLTCQDGACAAVGGTGHATITIHKATCPHGVGSAIFEECHDNVLGGVSFAIDGFEVGSGTITTGDDGVASATVLEAAATGDITVTEDPDVLAGYLGAYVYCAEQNSGTVLYDGSADTGAVTFTASQGDDVVCDWYNITEAGTGGTSNGTGSTTLPSTGVGPEDGGTPWLGAALLGGAAALLGGKKLREAASDPRTE